MGGAAGHMRHPFDLERVQSGDDFLKLFDDIKLYLKSPTQTTNVKIDGINVSFKLVGNQFAVDRGSLKEIDISGITIDRIEERFPEGHGMRNAITKLLTIFNEAYPLIVRELNALGLTRFPHFFLNTEYVEGAINATGYQSDFIAIHGVNAYYEKYKKISKKLGGGQQLVRPGMTRPEGDTRTKSVEVSYDKRALANLISKVAPIAEQYGFKLYGPVPAKTKEGTEINYTVSLNTPFEVNITDEYSDSLGQFEHLQGRPLLEWVNEIEELPARYMGTDYDTKYETTDGKKINPFHKNTYLRILSKSEPVDSFIKAEHVRQVVNGAVLMHATRLLGSDILKTLTSEAMGDLIGVDVKHEGIVLRHPQFSQHPFKITGEFIVAGMGGAIAQKMGNETLSEDKIRKMVRESITKIYLNMLPRYR